MHSLIYIESNVKFESAVCFDLYRYDVPDLLRVCNDFIYWEIFVVFAILFVLTKFKV